MRKFYLLLIVGLFILTTQTVNAQFRIPGVLKKAAKEIKKSDEKKEEQKKAKEEEKEEIIPTFAGSKPVYDDALGYDVFYICVGDSANGKPDIKKIEGYTRHRFCYLPKGRSAFEMFKNYEEAILKMDGTVFPISNKKASIKAFMKKGHPGHGMRNYEYMQLPNYAYTYFSGMIPTDTVDHYIAIAVSNLDGKGVYSLITVETKPMDMGMVSLENLDSGLVTKGHIAIYDIYFETGKSEIKGESYDALNTIAEYLKAHIDQQYFVVGHTDNVGEFDANITLSNERANAVVNNLIVNHSVNKEQLKSYGVGPVAPVSSNATDEGKAKNRRVEIVER